MDDIQVPALVPERIATFRSRSRSVGFCEWTRNSNVAGKDSASISSIVYQRRLSWHAAVSRYCDHYAGIEFNLLISWCRHCIRLSSPSASDARLEAKPVQKTGFFERQNERFFSKNSPTREWNFRIKICLQFDLYWVFPYLVFPYLGTLKLLQYKMQFEWIASI